NTLPAVYANAVKVWDWDTKKVRPSTIEDLTRCVRLAEAIDEIKVACPVCLPGDSPKADQMLHAICILLQNSTKMSEAAPQNLAEAVFWTEATAIADQDLPSDRSPSLIFAISPTSPLQIDPNTCHVLQHAADRNFPLLISPCPMTGGTSPVTMAGTTVQTHAEFLGILTVAQLLREGIPAVYGGSATPMDLRVGSLCYGAAEGNIMCCANIDIANHFNLPHFSSAGTPDSAFPDFQAGRSKALSYLTRLMKGTTLGMWFGCLLTGNAIAPEQIVLDADLYRAVESMLKGMTIDDERLAYDAIKRVGPGGSFLADEHTVSWMRDEYYYSDVINHEGENGKSMLDRAHEKVEQILADYQPTVSEKVRDDLEKFLNDHAQTA
ncbi:MAG: trimethylamine methyltransferase family protein, partial [Phycisphaerae bacterium]|nr:trimethylamine methyltransferase family protein [Phycisphaerae bacterium]